MLINKELQFHSPAPLHSLLPADWVWEPVVGAWMTHLHPKIPLPMLMVTSHMTHLLTTPSRALPMMIHLKAVGILSSSTDFDVSLFPSFKKPVVYCIVILKSLEAIDRMLLYGSRRIDHIFVRWLNVGLVKGPHTICNVCLYITFSFAQNEQSKAHSACQRSVCSHHA